MEDEYQKDQILNSLREFYNKIYDILVEHIGAREIYRDNFIDVFVGEEGLEKALNNDLTEYRIQGNLGYGGKFWRNFGNDKGLYVNCYPEDETPERLATIKKVNELIAKLREDDNEKAN